MMNDVFITESRHTAVPDWIALRQDIPWQARNLAHVILIKSRGPLLPTRDDLAEAMGVEVRTIDRWLADLRSFGMLRTNQAGRRNFFILTDSDSTSTPDPCDQRSMRSAIHAISDPCDQGLDEKSEQFLEQQEGLNGQFSEKSIADPPGGGGGSCSNEIDPPPTTAPRRKISPREIIGDTGKWMVAEGFSLTKAHQHQHLPLKAAQADYQRRRQLGQRHGAIADAWEVSPPAGAPELAPLEPSAGPFSFSEQERAHYRAMGFKFGDDDFEEEEAS